MIYTPALYDEWEWHRVDRLILSDPIICMWLQWVIKDMLAVWERPLDFRRDYVPETWNRLTAYTPRFFIYLPPYSGIF